MSAFGFPFLTANKKGCNIISKHCPDFSGV
jgi:hypothetical protein